LGGDDVRAAVGVIGFEVAEIDRAQIAIVDARDRAELARASLLPAAMPRVTLVAPEDRAFFTALGIDGARLVTSADPTILGPALVALVPKSTRGATKVLFITGSRGGVGRTLLAANLARRIGKTLRVSAIDATGSGALAWWLHASPKPWPELEAIADELTADQLALVADTDRGGTRVVGGAQVAPTKRSLAAVLRVASAISDLVIVDAPVACDPLARPPTSVADRRLILAYDDPWSALVLDAAVADDRDWLLISQSKASVVAGRRVFRSLPRDEASVSSAISSRSSVGGALGRAYDELAELIAIDATDT
jgi:hypothetical protein